eukprot:927836-Prorocentrum_minimum.AAC.1
MCVERGAIFDLKELLEFVSHRVREPLLGGVVLAHGAGEGGELHHDGGGEVRARDGRRSRRRLQVRSARPHQRAHRGEQAAHALRLRLRSGTR